MELTKEQEIRLGNFGEQLASIRTNIEVENKKLEGILKAKGEESVAFESRLKEHGEIMAKLRAEKEEMLDFIVTERARLAGDIRKLEADNKEFGAYKLEAFTAIELERAAIESERKSHGVEIQNMKDSIRGLNEEIQSLGGHVAKLSAQEAELTEEIDKLFPMITAAQEDIKHYEAFRDSAIALGNKEIKEKQKELIEVEAQIQEAVKRIEVPYNTLMLEKQEFEKYRMDVRVLYDRANRMWCVMYPGKSLEDILTKQ